MEEQVLGEEQAIDYVAAKLGNIDPKEVQRQTKVKTDYGFEGDPEKSYEMAKSSGVIPPSVSLDSFKKIHSGLKREYDTNATKSHQMSSLARQMFGGAKGGFFDVTSGRDKSFKLRDYENQSNPIRDRTLDKSQLGKDSIEIQIEEQATDAHRIFKSADGSYKSLDLYDSLYASGEASRKTGEGREYILVKEFDQESGEDIWVEKDVRDTLKNSLLRSMLGPQKMQEGYLATFAHSAYNEAANMFDSNFGSFVEMIGNTFGSDGAVQWGNQIQNLAGASRYKRARELETTNFFNSDSWTDINGKQFASGLGAVLGNLAPVILAGYVTAPLGAAAMGSEALNAGYQSMRLAGIIGDLRAGGETAKLALRAMRGRAITSLPTFGASLYAGDRINQEMKELGMDSQHRLAMYGLMTVMTGLTEDAIGSNAITRGLGRFSRGEIAEAESSAFSSAFRELAHVARESVEQAGGQVNSTSARSFLTRGIDIVKGINKKLSDWGSSDNRLVKGLSSALEEGTEEVVQGFLENSFKLFSNAVTNGWKNEDGSSYGSFDTKGLTDNLAESFILGAFGGFGPGTLFHSSKKTVSDAVRAASLADIGLDYINQHGRSAAKQKFMEDLGLFADDFKPKDEFTTAAADHNVFQSAIKQQGELVIDSLMQVSDSKFVDEILGGDIGLVTDYAKNIAVAKNLMNEAESISDPKLKEQKIKEAEGYQKYADYIISGKAADDNRKAALMNTVLKYQGSSVSLERNDMLNGKRGDYGFDTNEELAFHATKTLDKINKDFVSNVKNFDSVAESLKATDKMSNFQSKLDTGNPKFDEVANELIGIEAKMNSAMTEATKNKLYNLRFKALNALSGGELDDNLPNYSGSVSNDSWAKMTFSELEGFIPDDKKQEAKDIFGLGDKVNQKLDSMVDNTPVEAISVELDSLAKEIQSSNGKRITDSLRSQIDLIKSKFIENPKSEDDITFNNGLSNYIKELESKASSIEEDYKNGKGIDSARLLASKFLAANKAFGFMEDRELKADGNGESMKKELRRAEIAKAALLLKSYSKMWKSKLPASVADDLGANDDNSAEMAVLGSMIDSYSDKIQNELIRLAKEEFENGKFKQLFEAEQPKIEKFLMSKIAPIFGLDLSSKSWGEALDELSKAIKSNPQKMLELSKAMKILQAKNWNVKGFGENGKSIVQVFNETQYSDNNIKSFIEWTIKYFDHSPNVLTTMYSNPSLGAEGVADSDKHQFLTSLSKDVTDKNGNPITKDIFSLSVFNDPSDPDSRFAIPYTMNFLLQLSGGSLSSKYDSHLMDIASRISNGMSHEQVLSVKTISAFLNNSQNRDSVQYQIQNNLMSAWGSNTPNLLLVLGNAGSGKSTRATGVAVEMDVRNKLLEAGYDLDSTNEDSGKKINDGKDVMEIHYYISGFSVGVRNGFKKIFKEVEDRANSYAGGKVKIVVHSMSLRTAINKVVAGDLDGSLFIDEATRIGRSNYQKIREALKHGNNPANVLLFGDSLQSISGASESYNGGHISKDFSATWQSWKMLQVHRSGLPVLWSFQNYMRQNIYKGMSQSTIRFNDPNGFQPTWWNSNGADNLSEAMKSKELLGMIATPDTNPKLIVDAFLARIYHLSNGGEVSKDKIALIVDSAATRDLFIKKYNIPPQYHDNILTIDDHEQYGSQGLTIDEGFVFNDNKYANSRSKSKYADNSYKRDMLTVGTRFKNFVMLAGNTTTVTPPQSDRIAEYEFSDENKSKNESSTQNFISKGRSLNPKRLYKGSNQNTPLLIEPVAPVSDQSDSIDNSDLEDNVIPGQENIATEQKETPKKEKKKRQVIKIKETPKKEKGKRQVRKIKEVGDSKKTKSKKTAISTEEVVSSASIPNEEPSPIPPSGTQPTQNANTSQAALDDHFKKGILTLDNHFVFSKTSDLVDWEMQGKILKARSILLDKLKTLGVPVKVIAYENPYFFQSKNGGYKRVDTAMVMLDPSDENIINAMREIFESFRGDIDENLLRLNLLNVAYMSQFDSKSQSSKFMGKVAKDVKGGKAIRFELDMGLYDPASFHIVKIPVRAAQGSIRTMQEFAEMAENAGAKLFIKNMNRKRGDSVHKLPMAFISSSDADIKPNDSSFSDQMVPVRALTLGENEQFALAYINAMDELLNDKHPVTRYNDDQKASMIEEFMLFNNSVVSQIESDKGTIGLKAMLNIMLGYGIINKKTHDFLSDIKIERNSNGDLDFNGGLDRKIAFGKAMVKLLDKGLNSTDGSLSELAKSLYFPLVKSTKSSNNIDVYQHIELLQILEYIPESVSANPSENYDFIKLDSNEVFGVKRPRMQVIHDSAEMLDDIPKAKRNESSQTVTDVPQVQPAIKAEEVKQVDKPNNNRFRSKAIEEDDGSDNEYSTVEAFEETQLLHEHNSVKLFKSIGTHLSEMIEGDRVGVDAVRYSDLKAIWGYSSNSRIFISTQNGVIRKGSGWHEFAHFVRRNLLSDKVRNKLDSILSKQYPNLPITGDNSTSEIFAEKVRSYALQREHLTGTNGFVKSILDWFVRLWDSMPYIGNLIRKLEYDIYYGKFANKADSYLEQNMAEIEESKEYSLSAQKIVEFFQNNQQAHGFAMKFIKRQIFGSAAFTNVPTKTMALSSSKEEMLRLSLQTMLKSQVQDLLDHLGLDDNSENKFLEFNEDGDIVVSEMGIEHLKSINASESLFKAASATYTYESISLNPFGIYKNGLAELLRVFSDDSLLLNVYKVRKTDSNGRFLNSDTSLKIKIKDLKTNKDSNTIGQMISNESDFNIYLAHLMMNEKSFSDLVEGIFQSNIGVIDYVNGKKGLPKSSLEQYSGMQGQGEKNPFDDISDFFKNTLDTIRTEDGSSLVREMHAKVMLEMGALLKKASTTIQGAAKVFEDYLEKQIALQRAGMSDEGPLFKAKLAHYRRFFDPSVLSYSAWVNLGLMSPEQSLSKYNELYSNGVNYNTPFQDLNRDSERKSDRINGYLPNKAINIKSLKDQYYMQTGKEIDDKEALEYWGNYVKSKAKQSSEILAIYNRESRSAYHQNIVRVKVQGFGKNIGWSLLQTTQRLQAAQVDRTKDNLVGKWTSGVGVIDFDKILNTFPRSSKDSNSPVHISFENRTTTLNYTKSGERNSIPIVSISSTDNGYSFKIHDAGNAWGEAPHAVLSSVLKTFGLDVNMDIVKSMLKNSRAANSKQANYSVTGRDHTAQLLSYFTAVAVSLRSTNTKNDFSPLYEWIGNEESKLKTMYVGGKDFAKTVASDKFYDKYNFKDLNGNIYRLTSLGLMPYAVKVSGGAMVLTEGGAAMEFLKSESIKPSNIVDLYRKNLNEDNTELDGDSEDEGSGFYFFSEFQKVFEPIAERVSLSGKGTPKIYVGGNMRTLIVKETYLSSRFPQDKNGNHSMERQHDIYSSLSAQQRMNHPHYNADGSPLMLMLLPIEGSSHGLKDISVLKSIKKYFKETDVDKATIGDLIYSAMANFLQGVDSKSTTTFMDNQGERDIQVLKWDLRIPGFKYSSPLSNGIVNYSKNSKGKYSFKVTKDSKDGLEYNSIFEHIKMLLKGVKRNQELSHKRIENLAIKWGFDAQSLNFDEIDEVPAKIIVDFFNNKLTQYATELKAKNKKVTDQTLKDAFVGSGLIENRDYKIEKGVFKLGSDALGNNSPGKGSAAMHRSLNTSMYDSILKIDSSKSGEVQQFIEDFFKPYFNDFSQLAIDNNLTVMKEVSSKDPSMGLDFIAGYVNDDTAPEGAPTKYYLHPAYRALVVSHFISNAYTYNALFGSLGTFKDLIDYNKRANDTISPKNTEVFKHEAYEYFNAVLTDDPIEMHHTFSGIGNANIHKITTTDGAAILNPLWSYILDANNGGETQGMDPKAQQKRKGNFFFGPTNDTKDLKYSSMPLSSTDWAFSMSETDAKLKVLLNPNNKKYSAYNRFNEIYNDLIEKGEHQQAAYDKAFQFLANEIMEGIESGSALHKDMLANTIGVQFHASNHKSANKENLMSYDKMNELHSSGQLSSAMSSLRWAENGMQTFLDKDTEGTEQKKFTQMFNHLTLSTWGWSSGLLEPLLDNIAALTDQSTIDFINEGLSEHEKLSLSDLGPGASLKAVSIVANRIQSFMQSKATAVGDGESIAEMIGNPLVGIDYPQYEAKAFQFVRSLLMKTGVKFSLEGQRLTEVSSKDISVYDVGGGLLFSDLDLDNWFKNHQTLNGKTRTELVDYKRSLKPNLISLNLKKLTKDELSQIRDLARTELLKSNIHATEEQIDRVLNFDAATDSFGDDMKAMVEAQQSVFKKVREINKGALVHKPSESIAPPIVNLEEYGFNKYSSVNEIFTVSQGDEIKWIGDKTKAEIEELSEGGWKTNAKGKKGEPLKLEEISKNIVSLSSNLEMFVQRTPSTNASSGSMHRVVGWNHDAGSTIYSSMKRSGLTGHDQDGDEINAYYRPRNNSGSQLDKTREMFYDYTKAYYEDIDNMDYYMTPISLDEWKDAKSVLDKTKRGINFHSLADSLALRVNSVDGKTVGQFALAQKAFDFLASTQTYFEQKEDQAHTQNITTTGSLSDSENAPFRLKFNKDMFPKLIAAIGDMVNLATDNGKEQVLGAVFVNPDNAFMVMGMLLQQDQLRRFLVNKYPNGKKFLYDDSSSYSKNKTEKNKDVNFEDPSVTFAEMFLEFMNISEVKEVIKKQSIEKSAVTGDNMKLMEAWYAIRKNQLTKNKDKYADIASEMQESMLTLAKFIMTGDYLADTSQVFNYDQGIPNDDWGNENRLRLVEHLSGMPLDKILELHDEYIKNGKSVNTLINSGQFSKEGKAARFEHSKSMKDKFAASNEWYRENLIGNIDKTLNVWFGGGYGENMEFSNLAYRPFKDNNGTQYYSAEHYYQVWKSGEFDEDTYIKYDNHFKNPKNKNKGVKISGKKAKTEDNWNIGILEYAIKESFVQNQDIAQKLIETGSKRITHKQEKSQFWAVQFPVMLDKIRTELQENVGYVEQKENSENEFTYEQGYHDQYDFLTTLFARPDLMSWIKQAKSMRDLMGMTFMKYDPVFKDFIYQFASENGFDSPTKADYVKILNKYQEMFASKFLESNYSRWKYIFPDGIPMNNSNEIGWDGVADESIRKLLNEDRTSNSVERGQLKGMKVDLSNPYGQHFFKIHFPKYFEKIAQYLENNGYKDNFFIKSLRIEADKKSSGMTYVTVEQGRNMDKETQSQLRAAFAQLPLVVRQQLGYYVLVKDAFSYSEGSLSMIVDMSVHEDFGSFMENEKSKYQEAGYKERIANELKNSFKEQLLSNTPMNVLVRFNKKELDELQDKFTGDTMWVRYKIPLAKGVKSFVSVKIDRDGNPLEVRHLSTPNFGLNYSTRTVDKDIEGTITMPDNIVEINPKILEGNQARKEAQEKYIQDNGGKINDELTSDFYYFDFDNDFLTKAIYAAVEEFSKPQSKRKKNTDPVTIFTTKEVMYAQGDRLKTPFGITAIVQSVGKRSFTVTVPVNEESHALGSDLRRMTIHSKSINELGKTAMNTDMKNDYVSKLENTKTVRAMVDHFKSMFPNVDVIEIDNENELNRMYPDALSFVHEGVVYLNMDKVRPDVAMEEFAHVWNVLIKSQDSQLWNEILNKSKSDLDFMDKMRSWYGNRASDEDEIVANAIRIRFAQRQKGAKSNYEKSLFGRIWDSVKKFFKSMFGYGNHTVSKLDTIKPNPTLSEIIDAMLDDYEGGLVYSNITSKEVSMRLNNTMTAMATEGTQMLNLHKETIQSRLMYMPDGYDATLEKNLRIAGSIANYIKAQNQRHGEEGAYKSNNYYTSPFTGKQYEIPKFSNDSQLFDYILKNIVSVDGGEGSFSNNLPQDFADFLSSIGRNGNQADLLEAAKTTIKKIYANEYTQSEIEKGTDTYLNKERIESMFEDMLSHLNFNRDTDTALLDTADFSKYGLVIPESVQTGQTIVILHNAGTEAQSISLIQMSNLALLESFGKSKTGIKMKPSDISLIDKVLDSTEKDSVDKGRVNGVSWTMRNDNIQKYISGLQLIAMKQANPNLTVKNILPFKFNGSERGAAMFSVRGKDTIFNILSNTEAMLNYTIEHDAMPNEVKSAFANKENFDGKNYGQDPISAIADLALTISEDLEDDDKTKIYLQNIAKSAKDLKQNFVNKNLRAFQRLLKARIKYIEINNKIYDNVFSVTSGSRMESRRVELMLVDHEYKLLREAYIASERRGEAIGEGIASLNTAEKFFMSGINFKEQIEQFFNNRLQVVRSLITDRYMKYADDANERVKAIKAAFDFKGWTTGDISDQVYEGLWIKEKMSDGSDFNTGRITVGKDFNETFSLVSERNKDKSLNQQMELAKTAWFFENAIVESLVDSLIQERGRMFTDDEGNIDRQTVRNFINRFREPGTMPVIPGGLNQELKKITERIPKEGYSGGLLKDYGKALIEELYPDWSRQRDNSYTFQDLSNVFLKQFPFPHQVSDIEPPLFEKKYGTALRQKLLGITINANGEPTFAGIDTTEKTENQRLNSAISNNLQYVSNVGVLESIETYENNDKLVPIAESLWLKALNVAETSGDNVAEKAKMEIAEVMKAIYDKQINHKIEMFSGTIKIGQIHFDPNSSIVMMMFMKGAAVFGFNVEAAFKNGLQAAISMQIRGLASRIAETNKARISNIQKIANLASTAYLSDPFKANTEERKTLQKFELLNRYLHISELDSRNLINSPMLNEGEKVLRGKDTAMHFFKTADKVIRLIRGFAQLDYEGLWDAFEVDNNGNLSFDILKWNDERYVKDGKLTPDGEIMNRHLINQHLIDGGVIGEMQQKALDRGYKYAVMPFDKSYLFRIKNMVDMELGSMSEDTKSYLHHNIFWAAVGQFWSYAPQYFWNFFGTKNKSMAIAQWEVDKGKIVEKMPLIEGVMESLSEAYTILKDTKSLGETWEQLEPQQKENIGRVAITIGGGVLMFGVIAALLKALAGAEDDKDWKRKSPKMYYAFNKIAGKAYMETASEMYFAHEIGKKFRGLAPSIDWAMSVPEVMIPLTSPKYWTDEKFLEKMWNGDIDRSTGQRRAGLKSVIPYGIAIDKQILGLMSSLDLYGEDQPDYSVTKK